MNKEKRKEYIITGFAFMILSGLCLIIFNYGWLSLLD
jgi:hypothetical protein